MKKAILIAATVGLMSTPVMAQVNQGQGGAPSATSGGTMDNPRTRMDKGPNSGSQSGTIKRPSTTGAAPAGRNSEVGNTGKVGGEGGSGR